MIDGGYSNRPAAAIYQECVLLSRGFAHVVFDYRFIAAGKAIECLMF
jgi:hypothetical protein